jgi:hypothetical protein
MSTPTISEFVRDYLDRQPKAKKASFELYLHNAWLVWKYRRQPAGFLASHLWKILK